MCLWFTIIQAHADGGQSFQASADKLLWLHSPLPAKTATTRELIVKPETLSKTTVGVYAHLYQIGL